MDIEHAGSPCSCGNLNCASGLAAPAELQTVVTDSAELRSIEVAARAALEKETRQRELLGMAMARGKMALNANTRAMFLHHAAAALKHMTAMGVD